MLHTAVHMADCAHVEASSTQLCRAHTVKVEACSSQYTGQKRATYGHFDPFHLSAELDVFIIRSTIPLYRLKMLIPCSDLVHHSIFCFVHSMPYIIH